MKRYESYKDSGVKWLGEIPGHWEVRKIKYTFKERSQKGFPKLSLLTATQQYGVIKKDDYENRTVVATKGLDTLKLVCKNDFVISLRSFEGGIEMSHEEGIISPAYTILIPKKIEPSYFRHLGKSPVFINLLKMMVTGIREGQNIDYNKLRTNLIPIPPNSEQTAIANYLDSVTSKIDEAISQQQKMIDLLNERKQIIVQNAVTKGLDPNAKMKDSGVEWIGEIPEDWELYKLKYLFRLNKLKNVGNKCKTILSLSYGKIIIKKDLNEGLSPGSYDSYQLLNSGDIVIRSTDLQNDHTSLRTGLVKFDGAITSAYIGLKNLNTRLYDSRYYQYFLHNWDISKAIYNEGKGLRQSLNWDDIKNMLLPVLDINEQTAIANYLDSITSKIDYSISQCNKMISLLQERKQIIINDVVTGKVKVI